MKINIDHLLKIGKTHKICEDYIISGYDPVPYIILADGCSSSKNTDVGARILCLIAQQYLMYNKDSIQSIDEFKMWQYIIHKADTLMMQLGLMNTFSLDATLIIAYYHDGLIKIIMYGDGSIISTQKNCIKIETVDYTKNTPYYLSYILDRKRNEIYRDNKIIKTVDQYYSCGDLGSDSLVVGTQEYDKAYISTYLIKPDKDKTILICSDGISSFLNREQSKFLHLRNFIDDFISFKTLKGEFLKRRLLSKKGAITKLEQQGYEHLDDLSIGDFVIE